MENQDFISRLRQSRYIREKQFGDVSSFNFTRNAFNEGHWTELTTTARGLYIDTTTGVVVARGYNKFFNLCERPETEIEALHKNLKFPVTAYRKENGYLGLISCRNDNFFFATKSELDGEYAKNLNRIFYSVHNIYLGGLLAYLKATSTTLVVEVIDPKNDPHIIEYSDPHIVVLDIITNSIEFSKMSYPTVKELCELCNMRCKQQAYRFTTWESLAKTAAMWEDKRFRSTQGEPVEGFVLEDASGFMFKVKTGYYKHWKRARSAIARIAAGKTCEACTPFTVWYKNELDAGTVNPTDDIITLRRKYESIGGV